MTNWFVEVSSRDFLAFIIFAINNRIYFINKRNMKSLRRQLQRQQSCQSCLVLAHSLKEYSREKSGLTEEILSLQDVLIQLKQDVKHLRIESLSGEDGLKERGKLLKRPQESYVFTTFDDTDYDLPRSSLSISSRPPLVRPRVSKHFSKITTERPLPPPTQDKAEVPVIPEEDPEEFYIPKSQPGCEVCVSLESQIKREIGEIRLMNKSLSVKREEIAEHQREVEELEKRGRELKRQTTQQSNGSEFAVEPDLDLSPSSQDFSPSMSSTSDQPYWHQSNGSLRGRGHPRPPGQLDYATFSSLLQEYQTGQQDLRSLQERQNYLFDQLCAVFLQTL